MLPFKVIFFDLGNTLIYFDTDWPPVFTEGISRLTRTLISAGYRLDASVFAGDFLKKMQENYSLRSKEQVETTTESVLRSVLETHGYPSTPSNHLRPALNALYSASQAHWRVEADAISTLSSLKALGCQLGIISNAADSVDVHTLLDNARLRPYFSNILVSAEVGYRKPHPIIFERALDYFQISHKDAVMIGDTLAEDILGANNLRIASIWITRRADTPENRENSRRIIPEHSINRLDEIPSLLMNW
jgi:HAD superfamily hydrolase (TIGR01549 family)